MDFIVHSGLGDSQWVFDNLNSLSVRPLGAMALSSCHFIFPKDPQNLSSFLCLYFPCTLPFKPVYHWRCHLEALISTDIILGRHFMYSSVKKKGKDPPTDLFCFFCSITPLNSWNPNLTCTIYSSRQIMSNTCMFFGEAANLSLLLMDFKWMGQCISFPNYSIKLQIIANTAPGQAAIYKKNKPQTLLSFNFLTPLLYISCS